MTTLDAIQARADAATEGPWFREYNDVVTSAPDPDEDAAGFDEPQQLRITHGARHLGQLDPVALKNATFIAHAREDVPKLVAALRAVEAVVVRMQDGSNEAYCIDLQEILEALDG